MVVVYMPGLCLRWRGHFHEVSHDYVQMPLSTLTDRLGLHECKNRKWYIQSTCAVTGAGLYEGLDWLADAISRK